MKMGIPVKATETCKLTALNKIIVGWEDLMMKEEYLGLEPVENIYGVGQIPPRNVARWWWWSVTEKYFQNKIFYIDKHRRKVWGRKEKRKKTVISDNKVQTFTRYTLIRDITMQKKRRGYSLKKSNNQNTTFIHDSGLQARLNDENLDTTLMYCIIIQKNRQGYCLKKSNKT